MAWKQQLSDIWRKMVQNVHTCTKNPNSNVFDMDICSFPVVLVLYICCTIVLLSRCGRTSNMRLLLVWSNEY